MMRAATRRLTTAAGIVALLAALALVGAATSLRIFAPCAR